MIKGGFLFYFAYVLTLIGLGFFKGLCLGRMPPSLSSLFVDLSQQSFAQGLIIKGLAQIWKRSHKFNDVIASDVIILRHLAKETVKVVYFKIADSSLSFIQSC